jgi:AcrR family transcriptional regulator
MKKTTKKPRAGSAEPKGPAKRPQRRSGIKLAGPGLLQRRSKRPTEGVDTRIVRSREALRSGLLSLLEKKQFEQITIRDIAAQAKVGYATFFRHHPSKEDLLSEIATEEIQQLMSLTLPLLDARDTRVSCLALCNYVEQHRLLWSVLLAGGAAAALRAELIRLAKQWAPKVRTSHWIPVELGTVYGVAAAIEILSWWLHQPAGEYSAEQVAEFLDRLVVAPATAPDRRDKA